MTLVSGIILTKDPQKIYYCQFDIAELLGNSGKRMLEISQPFKEVKKWYINIDEIREVQIITFEELCEKLKIDVDPKPVDPITPEPPVIPVEPIKNPPSASFTQIPKINYPQSPLREDVSAMFEVGEFDFPRRPDGTLAFQAVFIGSYRNQIGDKLFKLGFSSVSRGSMIEDVEAFSVNGNPRGLKSTLKREQRFIMRGMQVLHGLKTGHPESDPAYPAFLNSLPDHLKGDAISLFQMEDYYQDNGGNDYKTAVVNHCGTYGPYTFGDDEGIAGLMLDFEADFGPNHIQDFVNRQYALHRYMKDALKPGTKYCIMYNNTPFKPFHIDESYYNILPNNPVWIMPVAQTSNSLAKKMPEEFVGQRLSDLGEDLLALLEAYFALEDYLPEGAEIILPEDTVGGSKQKVTHFGEDTHWVKHWAAYIGFIIEINRKYLDGRKIIINICNTVGARNGYYEYWNPQRGVVVYPVNFIGDLAYEAPQYIQEGKCLLIVFSGAWYSFWLKDMFGKDSTGPGWNTPIPTKIPVYDIINVAPPEYGGYTQLARDLSNYAAMSIAAKRLAQIESIFDGNEIYLCDDTEVDYLDGFGFNKIKASQWRDDELSVVRLIVNEQKGEFAVLGIRAYVNSKEPSKFKVRYKNWISPVLEIREATPEIWHFKF